MFKGPGGNPDGSGQGQELKRIPAANRPKDMKEGRVYGDAGQPKAPKLPPKPKATTPTKPAAPKPTKKDQSSAENLREWAIANEEMINKVGTKTQKAILKKALKPKKQKEEMKISAARKAGYQGSRLY